MNSPESSALLSNTETPAMSAYRWLLILGFPENVAAESVLATHGPNPPAHSATRTPFPAPRGGSRPPLAA